MVLIVGLGALAPAAANTTVDVALLDRANVMLGSATPVVDRIFDNSGISFSWRLGVPREPRPCRAGTLLIVAEIVENAPAGLSSKALAASSPYSGCEMRTAVFYGRIRNLSRDPASRSAILGHVLAHELFHLLQGGDYHGSSGLMNARWTIAEYRGMTIRPMSLSAEECRILQAGISRFPKRLRIE